MTKSGKHCGKRRNCTFCAISSFVTMFSKILYRAQEILSRASEILSRAHNILSRASEILSRAHKILSRANYLVRTRYNTNRVSL